LNAYGAREKWNFNSKLVFLKCGANVGIHTIRVDGDYNRRFQGKLKRELEFISLGLVLEPFFLFTNSPDAIENPIAPKANNTTPRKLVSRPGDKGNPYF